MFQLSDSLGAVRAASPRSGLAVIGGLPKLPIGKRGAVVVVARGPYDNTLPIVVRNNTKTAVADVHVGRCRYLPRGEPSTLPFSQMSAPRRKVAFTFPWSSMPSNGV